MDHMTLVSGSHHCWLGFWREVSGDAPRLTIHMRRTTHCLLYLRRGRAVGHWTSRGHSVFSAAAAGAVRFDPADGEEHTFIGTCDAAATSFYTLLIPQWHMAEMAAAEGIESHVDFRSLVTHDDPILSQCLERLASSDRSDDISTDHRKDEAARRLVLRLAELSGCPMPDWHLDQTAFDRRTLGHTVSYIDAHLRNPPSLGDLALLAGRSPSHFAKKFRHSTGLSVHRFINRRRVQASLHLLKTGSLPLAHVALELGFSSQSHFTRLFSEMTGMTPARYRKQFVRTPR